MQTGRRWFDAGASVLRGFGPPMAAPRAVEVLRASAGGMVGLLVLALLAMTIAPGSAFVLPLAASAILVFALPNSPLAQPWPVVVGNAVSTGAGAAVALILPESPLILPLAFGLALTAMMLCRALHPPGAAMAVVAAAGGVGLDWAIWPVAVESAVLVGVGIAWNRMTGRVYPFRQPVTTGAARPGLDPARLEEILRRFRQSANIGVEDLARILSAVETEVAAGRMSGVTCAEVMTRGPVSLAPGDTLRHMLNIVQQYDFASYPVVDNGRVVGLVTERDLIVRNADLTGNVADLLHGDVPILEDAASASGLLPYLAEGAVPAVVIVDGQGGLAGIVTRSDLLRLFVRELALVRGG